MSCDPPRASGRAYATAPSRCHRSLHFPSASAAPGGRAVGVDRGHVRGFGTSMVRSGLSGPVPDRWGSCCACRASWVATTRTTMTGRCAMGRGGGCYECEGGDASIHGRRAPPMWSVACPLCGFALATVARCSPHAVRCVAERACCPLRKSTGGWAIGDCRAASRRCRTAWR
jgi:hypothetical protein